MRDYKRLREYWETHSVADEWDGLEDADIEFERPTKIGVTIRLDKDVVDQLKAQAQAKGLAYTAYMRSILTQMAKRKKTDLT